MHLAQLPQLWNVKIQINVGIRVIINSEVLFFSLVQANKGNCTGGCIIILLMVCLQKHHINFVTADSTN